MDDEISAIDVIAYREAFFDDLDAFFIYVVASVDVKLKRRVRLIEDDAVFLRQFLVRREIFLQLVDALRVKTGKVAVSDVAARKVQVDVEVETFKARAFDRLEVLFKRFIAQDRR